MLCGLAPMEGTTEFPVRLWYSLVSQPAFACAPFVRVTASYPRRDHIRRLWPELFIPKDRLAYQFRPQFMASSVDDFLRAFEPIADLTREIEVNCGCPAPKAVGHGAGSSILRNPDQFADVMDQLSQKLGAKRLCVKMRTGFDSDEHFNQYVDGLSGLPLARVVIHGRTRRQHYTDQADWHKISSAAERIPVEVVGSGDIVDCDSLEAKKKIAANLHSAIIGRGALRNPWVFEELRTQSVINVERQTLLYALASYYVLVQLYHDRWDQLVDLVEGGAFREKFGTSAFRWQLGYSCLTRACYERVLSPIDLPNNRFCLGRLKMIWNSLRSSLSDEAMDPKIFRAKTPGEFFERISNRLKPVESLMYNPAHDWLYSGRKLEGAPS